MDIPKELPATLFSPSKMVYISYVVLAALKVLPATMTLFVTVSLLFLVAEVLHNDYLRIRLNKAAANGAAKRAATTR